MARPGKRFTLGSRLPCPLRIAGFAVLALLALPYLIVPFFAFGKPVSTVMLWRKLAGDRMQRSYVPLSRISPALALAVIVAEDEPTVNDAEAGFGACVLPTLSFSLVEVTV